MNLDTDLSEEERRYLAMHARYRSGQEEDVRYQDRDPAKREALRTRWREIADALHPDPWDQASDDRQPHGSFQAAHWPDAIPESVWCATCDARRNVVGRFGSVDHDYAEALHLDCGHRYEITQAGRS